MRIVIEDDIGIKVLYESLSGARDANLTPFVEYDFSIFLKNSGRSALIA